jgi:hypothetical protein
VARHLRLGEFLLGVEGIALMRHLFDDDAQAATRLAEIRRIACGGEAVYQLGADVPIVDVASGYARWSQTYDNPGNPLIHLEQPVVWSILDAVAPGAALDAACGPRRPQSRCRTRLHREVPRVHRLVRVDTGQLRHGLPIRDPGVSHARTDLVTANRACIETMQTASRGTAEVSRRSHGACGPTQPPALKPSSPAGLG